MENATTVRLPREILDRVRESAKRDRRSIVRQLQVLLEKALAEEEQTT